MGDSITKIVGGISEQVGTYLPNIAAAIGVLVVGWIIAKILARVAKVATAKTGVDQHLAGLLGTGKQTDMSAALGKIVYYIAMLFVFVTFFNVLDLPVVSEPLSAFLNRIFEFAPQAISALVLGVIAWGLATVARLASRRGLEAVDIDGKIAAIGQDASTLTSTARATVTQALSSDDTNQEAAWEAANEATRVVSNDDDAVVEFGNELAVADETFAEPTSVAPAMSTSGAIATKPNEASLAKSLPEAIYWLVMFLFLPAILGALQMPGLLEPIQGMFEKALGYLPNVFGAGVILAVGLLVAKIIRQVITNLSASFGVDRLGQRVGLQSADGVESQTRLSGVLGVVAYATVLLPILVAALNTLDIDAVTGPASMVLERITGAIPGILGGVIVLCISYFVAKLISGIVSELLSGVGFDQTIQKLGLTKTQSMSSTPSELAGKVLLVIVMVLATMQALPMMGLEMFAGHLEQLIEFTTQVAVGLVLIGLGIYLSNVAASFIRESGIQGSDQLATVARVAIIIFAGAMGLERMGLSSSIVNVAFGTLLGGLGLAAAIAFGWGGRDAAKRLLDRYVA